MNTENKVTIKGKKIFVSGPMTGIKDYNRPAFMTVHSQLFEAGADDIYDPAIESLRPYARHRKHAWYMRNCLQELVKPDRQRPYYDLLVSLPGWDKSEGAVLERAVTEAIGIECVEISELELPASAEWADAPTLALGA